ncbi:hypothetical protein LWI29_018069 [Acer saccharum]|uniref:Uncharacterized protein n=1 Tax=Acer saccharum TaxID=4024 RepID=A0AA39SIT6_ACESA|nr:hypothetical protein LWI29_018069 [Acer saccharum]KAK1569011.1 hypothetical protein Q3G72_031692 [Acer saccharum]
MKKSGIFAASVAAASATAISTSSSNYVCNSNFQVSHQEKKDHENSATQRSSSSSSSSTEKFAPRIKVMRELWLDEWSNGRC